MNIIFYDKNGQWFSTVQIPWGMSDVTKAKQAKQEIKAHFERFGQVNYKIISTKWDVTEYYNDLMNNL